MAGGGLALRENGDARGGRQVDLGTDVDVGDLVAGGSEPDPAEPVGVADPNLADCPRSDGKGADTWSVTVLLQPIVPWVVPGSRKLALEPLSEGPG